ncbi:MAG TPA: beta-ketoacyl-ACP synthase 3 [Solirubrobacteraceae bacterium]|nr:beta-ketoacyl-ACP synthase 3 [Solirubrobacteraceae bacterium]
MPLPEAIADRGPAPVAATPAGAAVLGLGTALPERVVANAEVSAALGVEERWIVKRTGILERRWAEPGARLHELAAIAGAAALADADVPATDVDLVFVATCTADRLIPNTAPLVAETLGTGGAGAIDVGAACTGFVSGLGLAVAALESGRARRVLLIGAEILSRHTDPEDRKVAALFGDGAGATVLGTAETSHVGPVVLGSDGALGEIIFAERGDGFIRMDGPEVFRHAVDRMGAVAREACERAGTTLGEVDLLVFHQANARILQALTERLDLDPERVVAAIGCHGNTSAASIPLALDQVRRDGRLLDGASVLVAAFGAGLTWGATVVQWGAGDAS